MRTLLVATILAATACGGPASKTSPRPPAPSPEAASSPTPAKPDPAAKAEPYALAIVYLGWELWIGNDQLLPADDPARYPGMLTAIEDALTQADLAHTAPAGSQAVAISYAEASQIRVPLGPIAKLDAASLGVQKDYYNTKGSELVRGITLAVDELEKVNAPHKYLIVLSDGNDTNNEAAKTQLVALKKRAAVLGIHPTSFVYKAALSADTEVISRFTSHSTVETSAGALTSDLVHALTHPVVDSE